MILPDQLLYNKFSLHFHNLETENAYQETVIKRTKILNCLSWSIALFLSVMFGLLDKLFFVEQYPIVLLGRVCYVILSLTMLTLNIRAVSQKVARYNSPIFSIATGLFCILLISLSDPLLFSPYFIGIFFAFTGVFFSAGLGFKYSLVANTFIVTCFVITFGFFIQLETALFIIYNFFLIAILLVFVFVDYLVERLLRENFMTTNQLKESLDNVRQLSGLLPICSSCKKIRDDQGYWKQLETYIQTYSDVLFTHSLCHDCAYDLYGHQDWYEKMKKKDNIK